MDVKFTNGPFPAMAPQSDRTTTPSSAVLAPSGPKRKAAQISNGSGRNTSAGTKSVPSCVLKAHHPTVERRMHRSPASAIRSGDVSRSHAFPFETHDTRTGVSKRKHVMFERAPRPKIDQLGPKVLLSTERINDVEPSDDTNGRSTEAARNTAHSRRLGKGCEP